LSLEIVSIGGWVEYNRVNGNLALSRALGDFVFKRNASMSPEEQMVIALPDVEVRDVNEEWEFVLLACDGIWDVVTNEVCT
jgi:protein phosphatase 2C family protein 2/3